MSILVVDDNPMNVMVVREMLNRSGYEDVRVAYSAEEMFAMLRPQDPAAEGDSVDLILLDLMMPAIDGIKACHMLQKDEQLRDIPVIMVTAIGDSRKLAEALDAGATDYVTKPINKIELLARIRSALRLKRELDWHKERDRRLREELNLARQVQEAVLPNDVDEENLRVNAFFRASEGLAGDLYAWHVFDSQHFLIAVMDAMGHGISSSLISTYTASVLHEAMRTTVTPKRIVEELNRRLLQLQYDSEMMQYYCTGICAWIDLENGVIEYVNAGHPPGLLTRADGEGTEQLAATAPPIGLFDQMEAKMETAVLRTGDVLHLYTDGLLDLFPGDMDERIGQLTERVFQAGGNTEELEALMASESLDRRPDDRCLVRVEVKKARR
ncbi:PP2C family protein-serine/threonine phosphatase [Cohnella nanjingensis]|uniref:Fused response regulator/phosphatase n=1 Tax=Cohnella nanjingensis TaxID=1387779 RepID=A0A7X0RU56_9BACL|nr:fused response regulator/phosphatase [Cohnella nanjingensis]MBB6672541.1 fused response regulator/phosphatase [Cohnella nanjingensis]